MCAWVLQPCFCSTRTKTPRKYSSFSSVRTKIPGKYSSFSLVPRGPKSLENTAVSVPQQTKIPGKCSRTVLLKYSTFGSARTNLKMPGNRFWGEKPKSLEHNAEFGLSLHLSTRLLHYMRAQGVAPCKLAERRKLLFFFFKLLWN